jgi:peptidoglycan/xylan/chitin deacetylase (PgdA/CDA1 family)
VALRGMKTVAAAADRVHPPGHGVVVLLYHRVGAGSGVDVDMPVELFHEQMAEIAASGRAASLDNALAALADAEPPEHDPVVITFDDGTADIVEHALPVLVRHHVPATVYLATDFVDRGVDFPDDGRPLSWAAVREAVSTDLVTIGSHTHRHLLLDRLPPQEVNTELARSVELIGEHTGTDARHFAYPKGEGGILGGIADLAVRRHFESAAVADLRVNPYGTTDPYRLSRSPIQTSDGMRWFRKKLGGGMRLEGTLRKVLNQRRYAGSTT